MFKSVYSDCSDDEEPSWSASVPELLKLESSLELFDDSDEYEEEELNELSESEELPEESEELGIFWRVEIFFVFMEENGQNSDNTNI